MREIVSGGDTNKQLQLEVKSLPKASREQLMHDAGFSVHVPAGKGQELLALESRLHGNEMRHRPPMESVETVEKVSYSIKCVAYS